MSEVPRDLAFVRVVDGVFRKGDKLLAMQTGLTAEAEEMPDGLRINLNGEDGALLTRRQGEALAALQHIVAAVFRQDVDERLHGRIRGHDGRRQGDDDADAGRGFSQTTCDTIADAGVGFFG